MIQNITINLMVESVEESVKFYTEVLDFPLIFVVDEEKNTTFWNMPESWNAIFAQVWDEHNKIMIQQEKNLSSEIKQLKWVRIWASMSFYITIKNIDDYYNQLKSKVEILRSLETSWYWMKEFVIQDNSWYIIMFGEQDPDFKY